MTSFKNLACFSFICLLSSPTAFAQSPAWQNLNNQGQAAYNKGNMKVAEGFFQQAIEEARKAKTKDGWLAMSLNNLGNVFCGESKYADAIPLFDECVAILKTQPGVTPVMVASALNNLANAYQGAGQSKEAEATYRTALSANQKSTDPKRSIMASLAGLSNVLISEKKYPEAKPFVDQAIAYGEKHPEQDQHGLSNAYSESAELAMHSNDLKSAEALFLKASVLDEKLYGANSAQKAADLNNLAAVREREGKTTEAEALYQKANQVATKSDTNKEGSLQTLINLANFSNEHHQTDKAVSYLEQALPIASSLLGDDSADVVQLKNNLACLYINQSRYDNAEKLLFSAIVSAQDMKNPPLDTLATSCNNLGNALYKQQKYDEAEMLLERSVNFREKLSGPNDPSVGLAVNNLAQAYSAAGKYNEAEPLFQRAISILEKSASSRQDLKDCYQNYAAMQQLAGNQDEARQLASKAQNI